MFIAHYKFTHMRICKYVCGCVRNIYIYFFIIQCTYIITQYLFDIFQYLYTPTAQKLQQQCCNIAAILQRYCSDITANSVLYGYMYNSHIY